MIGNVPGFFVQKLLLILKLVLSKIHVLTPVMQYLDQEFGGGSDVLLALPCILQLSMPGNVEAALSALAEEPGKVCRNSLPSSAASQLPGGDLRATEALPGGRGTWEVTLPISYCLWVTRAGSGLQGGQADGGGQGRDTGGYAAWEMVVLAYLQRS